MRLARLTLSGFKSFADRTEFGFGEPVIGIVGPNGCGKSNIVDAIKWVLGERSSKSLRGKEMIDVIFAGSAGRKPSGMASVTLSFDNPVVDAAAEMVELQYGDHAPGEEFTGAGPEQEPSVQNGEYAAALEDAPLADARGSAGQKTKKRGLPIDADL